MIIIIIINTDIYIYIHIHISIHKSRPLNGSAFRHGLLCVDVGGRGAGTIAVVAAVRGQPEYRGGERRPARFDRRGKRWKAWRGLEFSQK